ncbi:unnamed protein product [Spodoptera exigua]|nr:unnamed protein product [Spodoptera exigua]
MECGPCGAVPWERARAPNFGLSGGGPRAPAPAPAPRAPPLTPAENTFAQHECWPNNDCDTGNHSLGKITHFPILPQIVQDVSQNKACMLHIIPAPSHSTSSIECSKDLP